jgi:hypothetical protein
VRYVPTQTDSSVFTVLARISGTCAKPCTICTPGALDLASDAVGTQDNSRTVEACRRAECDSLMCWVNGVSQQSMEIMHLAHMNREPLLPPPRGYGWADRPWLLAAKTALSEEARWRSETARLKQVTHMSKNRWEGAYIVSNQTQRAQRLAARPETDLKAYGEATESQSLLPTR